MIRGYPPLDIQRYLDSLRQPPVERCYICDKLFVGCGPLCPECEAWEERKWEDHHDEVAMAHAATNGTL